MSSCYIKRDYNEVYFYKADITELAVDVIINFVDEKPSHTFKSILEKGGKSLNDDFNEKWLGLERRDFNTVIKTKGGDLHCRNILHTTNLDGRGKNKGQHAAMKDKISVCLEEVNKENFKSVAFPVPDYNRAIFWDCYCENLPSYRKGQPKTIHCVSSYESPDCIRYEPNVVPCKRSLTWTGKIQKMSSCYIKRDYNEVYFYTADITELAVDVIINFVDEKPSHTFKSILEKGGKSLNDDFNEKWLGLERRDFNTVIKTKGGDLHCRNILHTTNLDGRGKNKGQHAAMKDKISVCLEEVNKENFKSVAFPVPDYNRAIFWDCYCENLPSYRKGQPKTIHCVSSYESPDCIRYEPNVVPCKRSLTWTGKIQKMSSCYIKRDYNEVYFYTADITELAVDVIINFVDEKPSHTFKSILEKGGKSLNDDFNEKWLGLERRDFNTVIKTKGGDLHCRNILHTTNLDGRGKNKGQHAAMKDKISVCLEEVNKENFKSVAFPVPDYNRAIFWDCYCENLPSYRKGQPKTIHCVSSYESPDCIRYEPNVVPCKRSLTWTGKIQKMSSCYIKRDYNEVYFYTADITELAVDVIINFVDEKPSHTFKSILEKGGKSLNDDFNEKWLGLERRDFNTVIKTKGGDLHCRNILHTTNLDGRGKNKGQHAAMKDKISVCLEEVNKENFKSVAFPVPDYNRAIFWDCYCENLPSYRKGQPKTIHCVSSYESPDCIRYKPNVVPCKRF